jgi:hypothetical protein
VSIGDLWPEINCIEGVGGEGATVPATCGHLVASASRPLFNAGLSTKGDTVAGLKDLRNDSGFRQASERVSIPKRLQLREREGCEDFSRF